MLFAFLFRNSSYFIIVFHLLLLLLIIFYLRALGGRYRLCMDLVESEDAFKPALSYALGSTLVCDTLEEAQELCFTQGEKVRE